jgi:hypothetical protein
MLDFNFIEALEEARKVSRAQKSKQRARSVSRTRRRTNTSTSDTAGVLMSRSRSETQTSTFTPKATLSVTTSVVPTAASPFNPSKSGRVELIVVNCLLSSWCNKCGVATVDALPDIELEHKYKLKLMLTIDPSSCVISRHRAISSCLCIALQSTMSVEIRTQPTVKLQSDTSVASNALIQFTHLLDQTPNLARLNFCCNTPFSDIYIICSLMSSRFPACSVQIYNSDVSVF